MTDIIVAQNNMLLFSERGAMLAVTTEPLHAPTYNRVSVVPASIAPRSENNNTLFCATIISK